jgi:CrcB protein
VRSFPWATLAINVTGSFALGVLLTAGSRLSGTVVVALGVGFLGAFTTFSSFSYETQTLVRTGRAPAALAYVAASVALGVGAATLGYLGGRAWSR